MMREMASDLGGGGNAPIDQDPVGSVMKMYFNPSADNIASQMGLPWPPR